MLNSSYGIWIWVIAESFSRKRLKKVEIPTNIFYTGKIVVFLFRMIKQKQYDWKDSNLALFGSDTERQVKSKYKLFNV